MTADFTLELKTSSANGKTYRQYKIGKLDAHGNGLKVNQVFAVDLSFPPKVKTGEKVVDGKTTKWKIVTLTGKPVPVFKNFEPDQTQYGSATFLVPSNDRFDEIYQKAVKHDTLFYRLVEFERTDEKTGKQVKAMAWQLNHNKPFTEPQPAQPTPTTSAPAQTKTPVQERYESVMKLKEFCLKNKDKVIERFAVKQGEKPLAFMAWVLSGKAGVKGPLDDGEAMAVYYECVAPLLVSDSEPSLE